MIPNPCWRKWEDLPGDGRRRFCGVCARDVHAVAAYSEAEWAELLAGGRVCAYLPSEIQSLPQSRRTVVAGALLTTIYPLMAQTGLVRVMVTDTMAAGIGHAAVTLGCADGKTRKMRADTNGVAEFADLPLGDCEVTVEADGFRRWRGNHVIAGTGANGVVTARLEVHEDLVGIYVGSAELKSPAKIRLRVIVSDASGSAVIGAKVTLVGANGKTRTRRADDRGVAEFSDVPLGDCGVTVEQAYFKRWQARHMVAETNGRLEAKLELGGAIGQIVELPKKKRWLPFWRKR